MIRWATYSVVRYPTSLSHKLKYPLSLHSNNRILPVTMGLTCSMIFLEDLLKHLHRHPLSNNLIMALNPVSNSTHHKWLRKSA